MDTTNYLILGSVAVFGIGGLHLLSLAVRHRNQREQLAMLEASSARKPTAAKKFAAKKKAAKKKSRR
jgi:hypothetical protein